jgi:hypothetical protein
LCAAILRVYYALNNRMRYGAWMLLRRFVWCLISTFLVEMRRLEPTSCLLALQPSICKSHHVQGSYFFILRRYFY